MGSTTTCFGYLSTEVSLPNQTTSSSETTLIEGSNPWKPFAYYWPTRLSIPRTSFFFEGITSVLRSIESTVFTTNVSSLIFMTHSLFRKSLPTKYFFVFPRLREIPKQGQSSTRNGTRGSFSSWYFVIALWFSLITNI